MRCVFAVSALVALASSKEMPKDPVRAAALYDSGVLHERIMAEKESGWKANSLTFNRMGGPQYPELHFAQCRDGKAVPFRDEKDNFYRCNNVNLHHFLSHTDLGSKVGEGSSSWGWVHKGREFAIIAQADGAAFAEITNAGKLQYLGRLPQTAGTPTSKWREIRRFKHYIVIGSETVGHHIQIFDLKKLLDIDYRKGPVTFDPTKDLTGFYGNLPDGRAHNVLANDASNFAYVVGARPRNSTCRSGLIFLDLSDPSKPTSPGCAAMDGYVHDAQCLMYKGPDKRFRGREICYGYNEDSLSIYDVTNKKFPELVSVTSYEGATYTHQGWVLDTEWQQYLVLDDEYDEVDKRGPAADGRATTYIWDISDLKKPKQTGYYKAPRVTIDHNQYVVGNYSYQSNYGAGISILDVSSIWSDPTGRGVKEVGWFDIYPEDDNMEGGGSLSFVGTWSSYADFPSGYILVNTIERGAWVLKVQDPKTVGRA